MAQNYHQIKEGIDIEEIDRENPREFEFNDN